MRDLRGVFSAISPSGLLIPVLLSGLLIAQSMSGMTADVDHARCALEDWTAALEVFESGQTDYQGRCVGASVGLPGEDLSWVQEQVELARSDFEAAVDRLTEDPWERAANYVGGAALVFFALFIGGMAAGSPMGSAVTAWSLSNGWTRDSWARSTLTLTVLAALGAYFLALLAAVAVIYTKINGAGIEASIGAPTLAALNPIPGLLYFAMLGVLVGLIVGRGEIGGMTAVVLAIADFLGSARFELAPFFPTSWHQTALGATPSPISVPTALGLGGAAAVALGVIAYWFMNRRRDVPDR